MQRIVVTLKTGEKKEFVRQFRAGGSWCLSGQFKGEWYVVTDEWGAQTAFSAFEVERVETTPVPSW